jgi:DNA ligase 1
MKRFAALYAALDASTATNAKIAALKNYFVQAPAQDAAWAIYFLAGGKPRQAVNSRLLREIAQRAAGVENWLFEESYQAVGDLAETIAHILPPASNDDDAGLAQWVIERIAPLRGQAPEAIEAALRGYWDMLDWDRRFLLTKLIGGGFRVGVSKLLVIRALAEHAALDAKVVAQRMMGMTDAAFIPSAERFAALLSHDAITEQDAGQPYPFFLAHQLDEPVNHFDALLGPVSDWLVEWKYDGIRGQIIRRQGQVWIWSRGEELVTDRFLARWHGAGR